MKKIIVIMFLCLCGVLNAQLNILESPYLGKVDMTSVKTLTDQRLRDTVKNNQFSNSNLSIRRINQQFKRKFGQSIIDSLTRGTDLSGIDTNIVKYYRLIFSNENFKKYEAYVRLRAESEIILGNLEDSVCIAKAIGFDKLVVGKLCWKSAVSKAYLQADTTLSYRVDYKSIVRAINGEKLNLYQGIYW